MTRTLALAAALLAASVPALAAGPAPQDTSKAPDTARVVLDAMDQKTDPCQDFYRYACGGWFDATKLPADQVRWGRGFAELGERNRLVLRALLDEATKAPASDAGRAKLGRWYATCNDEAAVDKAGAAPLKPLLAQVEKVKDPASLMTVTAGLHRAGVPVLFGLGIIPDAKNPKVNIAEIGQGGLGLPDRDYYLEDAERMKTLRARYAETITDMLVLAGQPREAAAQDTTAIVAFETELARIARPRAELRDPNKTYNMTPVTKLAALSKPLAWDRYLDAAGMKELSFLNVETPAYFEGLGKLVQSTKPETLRAYLRWHAVRAFSSALPKAFVDRTFEFYGKTLSGQKELQPRWKRCVASTDGALGELLGKLYVEHNFAGDSKTVALDMITRIEAAFEASLPQLAWMDDETRERAKGKLHAISNKIGYPEKWRDYGKLEVKAGDYFGNVLRSRRFAYEYELAKLGKPVDRLEWYMTPSTVNAYYNPLGNEMAFPAGILQPPFFHRDFPMAMNFGAIGMVMAHELTHGFDDQGRLYAADGRLVEWWNATVSQKFEARAQCIDDLYAGFEVQPGVKLNGKLTLGENIADFGGLKTSYNAWRQWAKEHPAAAPAVNGLTNDQLFFVGFAQSWCTIATPEIERQLAKTDPHSPPLFRVNGPVAHTPEFAQAFQCKPGTPMNPEKRCAVW